MIKFRKTIDLITILRKRKIEDKIVFIPLKVKYFNVF